MITSSLGLSNRKCSTAKDANMYLNGFNGARKCVEPVTALLWLVIAMSMGVAY